MEKIMKMMRTGCTNLIVITAKMMTAIFMAHSLPWTHEVISTSTRHLFYVAMS